MHQAYRFNPENFQGVLGLPDDLGRFYELYEDCKENQKLEERFIFEKHARDLFFTIKHRRIEGALTTSKADALLSYMEELLND